MSNYDYYAPLSPDEIQELRCLIGRHFYKDCGDAKPRCVSCGKEAEE